MHSDIIESPGFLKLWAWLETHKKQVLIGSIAVIVVALLAGTLIWQQGQKQVAASEALSRAIGVRGVDQPPQPEALLKVAADHPNTAAAGRAVLLAGARFFENGNYAEARAQFERFIKENPDSPARGQALVGIAASLEAEGKPAEAINAYREITERYPNEFVAVKARLGLGRLYEAQGNLEQARNAYMPIAQREFGTMGTLAMIRLQELFLEHPELLPGAAVVETNVPSGVIEFPAAPTNAPAETGTPAPANVLSTNLPAPK